MPSDEWQKTYLGKVYTADDFDRISAELDSEAWESSETEDEYLEKLEPVGLAEPVTARQSDYDLVG